MAKICAQLPGFLTQAAAYAVRKSAKLVWKTARVAAIPIAVHPVVVLTVSIGGWLAYNAASSRPKRYTGRDCVVSAATEHCVAMQYEFSKLDEVETHGLLVPVPKIAGVEHDARAVMLAPGARPAFTAWLVRVAHDEYPTVREETEAHRMVIAKFLRDWCRSKGMREGHCATHVSLALALFFVPNADDIAQAEVRNCKSKRVLMMRERETHLAERGLNWLGRALRVEGRPWEGAFMTTIHHKPVHVPQK